MFLPVGHAFHPSEHSLYQMFPMRCPRKFRDRERSFVRTAGDTSKSSRFGVSQNEVLPPTKDCWCMGLLATIRLGRPPSKRVSLRPRGIVRRSSIAWFRDDLPAGCRSFRWFAGKSAVLYLFTAARRISPSAAEKALPRIASSMSRASRFARIAPCAWCPSPSKCPAS